VVAIKINSVSSNKIVCNKSKAFIDHFIIYIAAFSTQRLVQSRRLHNGRIPNSSSKRCLVCVLFIDGMAFIWKPLFFILVYKFKQMKRIELEHMALLERKCNIFYYIYAPHSWTCFDTFIKFNDTHVAPELKFKALF
jgi:hypothetical protein